VGLAQIDDDAESGTGRGHISPNAAVNSGKPPSLEAQLIASNFKAAVDLNNPEQILKISAKANEDHDLYQDAWRLLDSKTRTAITKVINGSKAPAN
jgi:hypothetical protein